MNNTIPNNSNYDMPDDSFFRFYFLIHKNRIFTTKFSLKIGEITTSLLNMKPEDMEKIFNLTVAFARFADNSMAVKNEQTMTEFVNLILEIEKIAVTLPPYCYTNINLEKEKQRAERMKCSEFYGRMYDVTFEEYAEYERYKKLFSGYGIGLYIMSCCIAEISDMYFSQIKKRDEDNYTAAWWAFNEYSTLSQNLRMTVPYYDKANINKTMDVNLGVSGMIDPNDKEKLIMVETCEFHNAQSVIQYDFFKAVQYGRAPFRCHNCGLFFLSTDSYKTFYCNEKSPENPNRTCRQIGAKNKHKEKAENDPIIQTYNKARNKYYQQKFRGNISDKEYDKILRYLETMRDMAIRGKCDENGDLITYKTLEHLFEKNSLYKTLNIGGVK